MLARPTATLALRAIAIVLAVVALAAYRSSGSASVSADAVLLNNGVSMPAIACGLWRVDKADAPRVVRELLRTKPAAPLHRTDAPERLPRETSAARVGGGRRRERRALVGAGGERHC